MTRTERELHTHLLKNNHKTVCLELAPKMAVVIDDFNTKRHRPKSVASREAGARVRTSDDCCFFHFLNYACEDLDENSNYTTTKTKTV